MPTSLDAFSTLDLTLISTVATLSLLCGGLALRLQRDNPRAATDLEETPLADQQALPRESSSDYNNNLKEVQEHLKACQAEYRQLQQQLQEAQKTRETTLLQLHQVQDELEHYFLLSREQKSLLEIHETQQKRVLKFLSVAFQGQAH